MKQYDVVVVGSGFAGSIIANKIATDLDKRVLVVEKRNHIAGNMYDFIDNYGIRIQKYGPHTFHTNIDKVYEYLSEFCTLEQYKLKCEAVIDEIPTPTPFNFKTIDQFYSESEAKQLKKKLLDTYKSTQTNVLDMLNSNDKEIKKYSEFLFNKDYKLYTAKQWGKNPEEIDPSILKRVPIIFNYRDTYFNDKYEGVPKEGFTKIFEKMLNHKNITVKLNVDANEHLKIFNNEITYDGISLPIVYTGAIDELFNYKFGKLPYRSLWFEYEYYNIKDYQNVAIVALPQEPSITRITEYTKLPYQNVGDRTVIAKEYSVEYDKDADKGNEPYYPVLTDDSIKIYSEYKDEADKIKNLILCGRLADFKYYNMDQVIERALNCFEVEFIRKE